MRYFRPATCLAAVLAAGICLPAQADTPRDALVIAWNIDNLYSFDPAQIGETTTDEIMHNVCDPLILTSRNDAATLEPGLAESWQISADGLDWTFKMRPGVKHFSGNPVTARDAEWSYHRNVMLGLNSANNVTKWGIVKSNVVQRVRAVDDMTLVVSFDKPYPESIIAPYMFSARSGFVLDSVEAKKHEKDGDHANKWLSANTACAGAYKLRSWAANDTVVLERHDAYWRGPAVMRRVIIKHVPESAAQRLQLEKGDIDMARVLNSSDLAGIEAGGAARIMRTPRNQFYYITFNNKDPILSNIKVRQAMRYLIDYDGLAATVMKYEGRPRQVLVPIGAFGALPVEEGNPYKLDLAKAKQLLTEAGYPNGFEKELIFGNAFPYPDLAQHLHANAEKVGIKLKLTQMTYGQVITRHRGRNFDMTMSAYYVSIPDAHAFVEQMAFNPGNDSDAKEFSQYPSWRAAYSDPYFNDITEKALLERDKAKRAAMYRDIQLKHLAEGPFGYMFQTFRVMGVNNKVKDIQVNQDRVWYATATK